MEQPLLDLNIRRRDVVLRRQTLAGWGRCGGQLERARREWAQGHVDDRAGGVRGDGDAVGLVEDGAGGVDVVLQRGEDGGCVSEDVDPLRGAHREQGRHGGGEDERGAVDALERGGETVGGGSSRGERWDTWCSTTVREPAQKPPDEQRPLAMDPSSISTLDA